MKIKQIQSNEELQLALERIEEIWEVANEGTQELTEIDFLATMVSDLWIVTNNQKHVTG
jgi:hypothetical protein